MPVFTQNILIINSSCTEKYKCSKYVLRSNGLNYKTELSITCQDDDDAFMILVMMMNLSLSGCYYDGCENNRDLTDQPSRLSLKYFLPSLHGFNKKNIKKSSKLVNRTLVLTKHVCFSGWVGLDRFLGLI